MPSQSMSMSDFQKTAPVFWHTGMVAEVSSSVRYLPLEIWLHPLTLASSSAAVGAPPPPAALTVSLSRLGPPLAVVAVARTRLVPDRRLSVTLRVCQVVQAPVPGKLTEVPFTDMVRPAVVPL